jgi:tRNA pseudouridine-54 N-methylase
MVAMALPVAATPLSARTCILSNVASQKACKPGCCANKRCCETSEKNRATPSEPLAKSGGDQQNMVVSPSPIAIVGVHQDASAKSFSHLNTNCPSHSPPTLAFICIRLI